MHGFVANASDKTCEDCWQSAKTIAYAQIKKLILSKYNYDVVDYLNVNTEFSQITYKYVLLPIYVGHCKWKEKIYNFFVNGKNGKVTGKTPVSAIRIGLIVLLGLAVAAGILLLAYYYYQ